jgi:hypothetical protein
LRNEYLWDKSGNDEEVERLEKALAPLALRSESAPALPKSRRRWAIVSIAAVAAAAAIAVVVCLPRGAEVLKEDRTFDFGRLGKLTAEAKSRVRMVRQSDELIKLRLEEGTVRAEITLAARPRLFQVETPATTCVDLGCQYTLTVDKEGFSRVKVTSGKVAFVEGTREVYIPAGAGCTALPGRGSATPLFDDSREPFVQAVRAFDAAPPPARPAAAKAVAESATRLRDTLPLWHFLQDSDPAVVEIGFDALDRLAQKPKYISRDACHCHNRPMIEAWKEYLELLGAWW